MDSYLGTIVAPSRLKRADSESCARVHQSVDNQLPFSASGHDTHYTKNFSFFRKIIGRHGQTLARIAYFSCSGSSQTSVGAKLYPYRQWNPTTEVLLPVLGPMLQYEKARAEGKI